MDYAAHLAQLTQAGVSDRLAQPAARALMLRDQGLTLTLDQLADINAAQMEAWEKAPG